MRQLLFALVLSVAALAGPLEDIERLVDHGHYKRAQALLEKNTTGDPYSLYLQARLKLAKGDNQSARQLAERAVAARPNDPKYLMLLVEIEGEIADNASFFKKISMAGGIKGNMDKAASLDPNYVPALVGLMEYYLQAPGIVGGSKSKAREYAARIERLDPVEGAFAHARIAREEKNTAALEGLYQKAVAVDPRSFGAHMALANLYASEDYKKYQLAEKHARAALSLDSTRVGPYTLLAVIFVHTERAPDLDATLARAESAVPDDLTPYYQAGRALLAANKDPARAERYFRKYLTIPPELRAATHAHAYWRLAHALEKQGKKEEAVESLRTALRLKPDLEDAKKDLERLT
jgi:tetratricopeptide (TPR) repeat protein